MKPQNIPIAKAMPTDLPDIIELLEEMNLDMEDLHFSQFVCFKVKGELVAAGRVRLHDDGTHELCSLGVLPEHQGMGIGSAMVQVLLDKHVFDAVWVVTDIAGFFERFGFFAQSKPPESLLEKMERCVALYNCKKPQILCNQPV